MIYVDNSSKIDAMDLLLYSAMPYVQLKEVDDYSSANSSVELSQKEKNKIYRRINRERTYRENHITYRPTFEMMKRIAAAVLIVVSLSFAAVMSVEAVRTALWNAITEWYENSIFVKYENTGEIAAPDRILEYKEPILGDELDFDNTEHLTYTPESGTATAATTFTYTATKPGLFIADLTGYYGTVGTVKVNGVVINETNSHSNTWLGFSSPSVPLKTGDTITINLGYRSNMGYYNYQTFIPYKNHKYIKALSGVEDGPESTVVANAINTAVASLSAQIENDRFVNFTNVTVTAAPTQINQYHTFTATEDCYVQVSNKWSGSGSYNKGVCLSKTGVDSTIFSVKTYSGYGRGTAANDPPAFITEPVFLRDGESVYYKWLTYDSSAPLNPEIKVWTRA